MNPGVPRGTLNPLGGSSCSTYFTLLSGKLFGQRHNAPAAFLAARTALRTPNWHDREHYPYILRDINSERAIPILIDQLAVEESQSVPRSICRALLAVDVDSRMAERLESDDPTTRRAACTVAGWAGQGRNLETMLRKLLGDRWQESTLEQAERAVTQADSEK